MRTIAIIQARMGSKRLPGKVLMDLGGKPVLQWVVDAVPGTVNDLVVATPDREIAAWCNDNDIEWFIGPERDVLQRYCLAAERYRADVIVRLTGDCPLLDRALIAQVIALRERKRVHYASNVDPPTWPDGLDCEVMTVEAIRAAHASDETQSHEREHVTPWIRKNFRCANLTNPAGNQSHIKLSIDTMEDLERVRAHIRKVA